VRLINSSIFSFSFPVFKEGITTTTGMVSVSSSQRKTMDVEVEVVVCLGLEFFQ
jgi:hypothetical protein